MSDSFGNFWKFPCDPNWKFPECHMPHTHRFDPSKDVLTAAGRPILADAPLALLFFFFFWPVSLFIPLPFLHSYDLCCAFCVRVSACIKAIETCWQYFLHTESSSFLFLKKYMGLTKKKPARGENIEVRVLASKGQATGLIVYFLSCPLKKKCRKKPHSSSSSVTAFQNLPGALRRRLPVKRNDAVIFFNTKERKINTSNKHTHTIFYIG